MLEKLDNIVSGDHTDGNIAGSNHGWGFGGSNSKKNLLKREEENNMRYEGIVGLVQRILVAGRRRAKRLWMWKPKDSNIKYLLDTDSYL
jgi:hypothetical protein